MDVQTLHYTANVDVDGMPDPSQAHMVAGIQFKAQAAKMGHRLMQVRDSVLQDTPLYIFGGKDAVTGRTLMYQAKPGHDAAGNDIPHTAQATVRTDHFTCARCALWAISDGDLSFSGPLAALKPCKR